MCGWRPAWNTNGLSPRVRGSLYIVGEDNRANRSIPACAGEPGPKRSHHVNNRVYPRVCGGAEVYGADSLNNLGLSPRVRGSRVQNVAITSTTGSIPACAGEPRSTGRTA